jgi:hypothetical protein
MKCRSVAGVYIHGDIDADVPNGRPWDSVGLASAAAVAPSEPADDGSKRPSDPVAQCRPSDLKMGDSRWLPLPLLEDQAVDHPHGPLVSIPELLIEDLSQPEIGTGMLLRLPAHLIPR